MANKIKTWINWILSSNTNASTTKIRHLFNCRIADAFGCVHIYLTLTLYLADTLFCPASDNQLYSYFAATIHSFINQNIFLLQRRWRVSDQKLQNEWNWKAFLPQYSTKTHTHTHLCDIILRIKSKMLWTSEKPNHYSFSFMRKSGVRITIKRKSLFDWIKEEANRVVCSAVVRCKTGTLDSLSIIYWCWRTNNQV